MMKWIPPFATSGASATPPRMRYMTSLTLTPTLHFRRVISCVQRVRQQQEQRVIRTHQEEGNGAQLSDLGRSDRRVPPGLPAISKTKRVALGLAAFCSWFGCWRSRGAEESTLRWALCHHALVKHKLGKTFFRQPHACEACRRQGIPSLGVSRDTRDGA